MYRYFSIIVLFLCVALFSCKKQSPNTNDNYYFPENNSLVWETKSPLNSWDSLKLNEAFDFAASKNTYGLILLHNGKIVKEKYWNNWSVSTKYPLNSAGKSIVASIIGIAQKNGLLNINNKTSTYLGNGWTSLPLAKENLITVKHQLNMTTGLDDAVPDDNCTSPSCLVYKSDAGTRWAYHNAPYRLLQDLIAKQSNKTFQQYANDVLLNKIGISAIWNNYIMYTSTRDAARFGSFILNKGFWKTEKILADEEYYLQMTNTSQNLNLSYGFLWWLNGKQSTMVPGSQIVFNTPLTPNAPVDMISALGKDDKKIYVVPSLNIVIVRLGDNAGTSTMGPSSFDNEFWGKLKLALKY